MTSFFRGLWHIITGPTQFVVDTKGGVDRWGEIKAMRFPTESSVPNLTVYDIIWDDGEEEEGVPTHQFQWDGHLYIRSS